MTLSVAWRKDSSIGRHRIAVLPIVFYVIVNVLELLMQSETLYFSLGMQFLLQPIFNVYMDMGEEGLGQILPQPVKKKSESASWLIKMQVAIKTPVHFIAEVRLLSGLQSQFGQDIMCIRYDRTIVIGQLVHSASSQKMNSLERKIKEIRGKEVNNFITFNVIAAYFLHFRKKSRGFNRKFIFHHTDG